MMLSAMVKKPMQKRVFSLSYTWIVTNSIEMQFVRETSSSSSPRINERANSKPPIKDTIEGDPFFSQRVAQNFKQIIDKEELKIHQDKVELQWKEMKDPTTADSIKYYLKLSKFRLTTLVVLTTLAGYTMGCNTFDPTLAVATLAGTGLTSAAAASLNQFLEIPFDSQMMRTRNRPLVLQQLSSGRAITFSIISCSLGLTILATLVNPLTATLGALNLVVYSFVYTPMKRANIANTWVGSIVGAVPPVMGYTAASNFIDLPAVLLGLILYSWQFPHFNALSWNIRHDYARAGYRMMSVTNEKLCTRTALRHSRLLTLYCCLLSSELIQLTNGYFLIGSLPVNLYLIHLCKTFKDSPEANSSRKLFRYSLIHLPALLVLMLLTKKSKTPNQKAEISSSSSDNLRDEFVMNRPDDVDSANVPS